MGQREDDLRRINPGTFSDEQWKKIEADYDASAAAADANVAAEKAAARRRRRRGRPREADEEARRGRLTCASRRALGSNTGEARRRRNAV